MDKSFEKPVSGESLPRSEAAFIPNTGKSTHAAHIFLQNFSVFF